MFLFSFGWIEIPQTTPRTPHTKIQPKQGCSGTYRRLPMLPQGALLSVILPLILLCSHKLALRGMRTFPVGGHPSSSSEQGLCCHLIHSMVPPNPVPHGLSAAGTCPGGSQPEGSKSTSPVPSPGCVYLNTHMCSLGPGRPWILMSPWLPAHGGSWR